MVPSSIRCVLSCCCGHASYLMVSTHIILYAAWDRSHEPLPSRETAHATIWNQVDHGNTSVTLPCSFRPHVCDTLPAALTCARAERWNSARLFSMPRIVAFCASSCSRCITMVSLSLWASPSRACRRKKVGGARRGIVGSCVGLSVGAETCVVAEARERGQCNWQHHRQGVTAVRVICRVGVDRAHQSVAQRSSVFVFGSNPGTHVSPPRDARTGTCDAVWRQGVTRE